ncbi:MAG: ArnT family glycosyltransferase [Acidimicrobiales bacterium]
MSGAYCSGHNGPIEAQTDLDTGRAALAPRITEPSWATGRRFAFAIATLTVLTHLPGLLRSQVFNPDEGFLATQARVLGAGGRLYQDIVDRKPPLVPVLYEYAFKLTGSQGLWSVRLLAVAAHVITALLLASIARRRWGPTAAVAAGVLSVVASAGFVPADGQAANFEVFMAPLTVLAVWFADRDRPVSGALAVGLSTLTKQVAAVTIAPVAWKAWQRDRGAGLARVGVAAAAPIVVAAIWYGPGRFGFWVFTDSNGYLDPSRSLYVSAQRFLTWTGLFVAANLGAVILLRTAWARRRDDIDLWLWLGGAAIGVAAGLRFFGHYYLQLAPPLVLLAVGVLARSSITTWLRTGALAAVSTVVFVALAFTTQPAIVRPYEGIARAVDARTRPGEHIFVWGEMPQLYWEANRPPSSRFITVGFLTGYSGGRSYDRIGEEYAVSGAWDDLVADLASHPPALIVDVSQHTAYAEQRFATFSAYLHEHYRAAVVVDGALLYIPKA